MKRRVFLLIFTFLAVFSLSGGESAWEWDADKADSFFYAGDYDAAWLFYERAIHGGTDDAKVLFRAAVSFDKQQITENPDFGSALYTVSWRMMQDQYPDDPALALAEARSDPAVKVNQRFVRRTWGMIGAKPPRTRRDLSDGYLGRGTAFCTGKLEELATLGSVLVTEGPREAWDWLRGSFWSLFVAYVLFALVPGIILPAVMAITVAREGRKSYVTAYAFLIFWGPLGIHRFYMGRFVSGIIWLLTGGLAGIGLFFDIFLTGAYIRFWNEDHRGDRPAAGSTRNTGSGVSRRVKQPKPAKATRQKKVRAPKPPKAPKPKKAKKAGKPTKTGSSTADIGTAVAGTAGAAAAVDAVSDLEDFSFDEPSIADPAPAANDEPADLVSDTDDFGDLPDLDLGGDDFDIPSTEGELPELKTDNEDEFDLGSLE